MATVTATSTATVTSNVPRRGAGDSPCCPPRPGEVPGAETSDRPLISAGPPARRQQPAEAIAMPVPPGRGKQPVACSLPRDVV